MTEAERREAWLAKRREVVTSSDVAAILGVGYQSPMDVYLDKMGLREVEPTERMRWGLKLQRAILEEYAERAGVPIAFMDPYELVIARSCPLLGASLDGVRTNDGIPVDAKNVGFRTKEWGESGSSDIPFQYACQLHVQMIVTEAPEAHLAVLFGGNSFASFVLHRDPEIDARIIAAAEEFHARHIATGIPPPPDDSQAWRDFLQKHVRQHKDDVLPATPEIEQAIAELVVKRYERDVIDGVIQERESRIKSFIGEHAGVESPLATISWRQAKVAARVDWEEVVQRLLELLPTNGEVISGAVRDSTHTSAPSRRFLVKEKAK